MSSKIPRSLHLHPENKKNHKPEPKDTETAKMATKSDAGLKPKKENIQRKNIAPKVVKGVSVRYNQADLKEQNQHLTAFNEELQKDLAETQQRVRDLELRFSDLEKENAEVKKNLTDCHVLLVSAKIDPGEKVGEAAQENEDQRKKVMSVSTDLLNELIAFSNTASQQRVRLEEIQAAMTDLTHTRELMMQERESFSLEAAELEKDLREAEALLL
ncbi:small kinetochore-associated protein isoform X2 [Betta splendens]|uniref:Small kinetochore-associated protein isoform X2 n=1 Tax=Betta splendens TaxID=158456 RepID=A0A6P7LTH2_BETSP|nr:small kinetochore-associated protein isoform X2 [Betta splendens]